MFRSKPAAAASAAALFYFCPLIPLSGFSFYIAITSFLSLAWAEAVDCGSETALEVFIGPVGAVFALDYLIIRVGRLPICTIS